MQSKRIGKIYDGWWLCIAANYNKESNHAYYTLENQANKMIVILNDVTIVRIEKGLSQVSKTLYRNIRHQKYVRN
jgi:hypothetical protein